MEQQQDARKGGWLLPEVGRGGVGKEGAFVWNWPLRPALPAPTQADRCSDTLALKVLLQAMPPSRQETTPETWGGMTTRLGGGHLSQWRK